MAQRPANPVPASLQGRQRDKDTTAVINHKGIDMSGMCKSDAKQSSKNKAKWAAQVSAKTWDTHKAKVAKRVKKEQERHEKKMERRAKAGKPMRGDARRARRAQMH